MSTSELILVDLSFILLLWEHYLVLILVKRTLDGMQYSLYFEFVEQDLHINDLLDYLFLTFI